MATTVIDPNNSGMELHDLLRDEEFLHRKKNRHQLERHFEALQSLAQVFTHAPEDVLQKLVDIAVEFCGAESAGISLEEPDGKGGLRFRWIAVAGSFQRYLGCTTPRNYSPCGTCLDSGRPQLYRVTKPYYDFLGVVADPITDGVLIPWKSDEGQGTLWAISHHSNHAFDVTDYKLLDSLAEFAAIAIRFQQGDRATRKREQRQGAADKAHEMAHAINNPLQSLANTLYLANQGGEQAHEFVQQALHELDILSERVRELLS